MTVMLKNDKNMRMAEENYYQYTFLHQNCARTEEGKTELHRRYGRAEGR